MVRGASQIAAVLRTNVNPGETQDRTALLRSPGEMGPEHVPPTEIRGLGADSPERVAEQKLSEQAAVEHLMEKLAAQLEFELIRTYGTSGR